MKTKLTLGTILLFAVLALLVTRAKLQSQDVRPQYREDPVAVSPPVISGVQRVEVGTTTRYAYGERVADPLVSQYIELSSKLANRMTEEELQVAIAEMAQELDRRNADDKVQSARVLLQDIIDSHPGTPAADVARRALHSIEPSVDAPLLDSETESAGFFDPLPDDPVPLPGPSER